MTTIMLPTLDELFVEKTGMRFLLQHKAKITITAELLLFTQKMLSKTPGLLGGDVVSILNTVKDHGLTLRFDNETTEEAVIRLFGSRENAPIEVLNFTSPRKKSEFRPLKAITNMDAIDDSIYSIRDLQLARNTISLSSAMGNLDGLSERLIEWDLLW